MKSPEALSTLALIGLISLAGAQGKSPMSYPVMAPLEQYRSRNVQEEIALARSAAPASISAAAEVLVLGKRGYETAVSGSNGFVCFVERSWTAGLEGSPILGKDGLPSEPTVLFIPVRQWSDGSLAPPPPTEHHHGGQTR